MLALAAGWAGAELWERWGGSVEDSLQEHAWSLRGLKPGQTYHLASFPVPPGAGAPPTFTVTLNRYGIREREFPAAPAAGRRRVIAVGDSTTFGTGVEIGQRFTEHLQRALDVRHPGCCEVLNAGLAGMSTETAVNHVDTRVTAWKPSVLIFGTMTNDIRDAADPMRVRAQPADLGRYQQELERLVGLCQRQGVALILWGNVTAQENGDLLRPYRDRMRTVAAAHRLPYVDLDTVFGAHPATPEEQQAFRASQPWTDYWTGAPRIERAALHMDWAHPNRFGHARLGDALLPLVERLLAAPRRHEGVAP